METIEVVVGGRNPETNAFDAFRARFNGKHITDFTAEKHLTFTLYQCGWNEYEGYRVYKSDESDLESPEYTLLPYEGEAVDLRDPYRSYHILYSSRQVVSLWPFFAGHVDYLQAKDIDAVEGDPAWNQRA